MKFSLAATALCALSSTSVAAVIDNRAPTVVGTIDASVGTVKDTLPTYLSNIESSVATIANEANVYTAIAQAAIAAIQGSAKNITAVLNTAAGNILRATLTATGEINTKLAVLVQSEVDLLAQDLRTIGVILQNINATVTIVHADLDATANQLIQSEVAAVASAIQPFVGPVTAFANAAATLSIGAQVSGLRGAVTGTLAILARLIATIGI